jgi:hypothetical protein
LIALFDTNGEYIEPQEALYGGGPQNLDNVLSSESTLKERS